MSGPILEMAVEQDSQCAVSYKPYPLHHLSNRG